MNNETWTTENHARLVDLAGLGKSAREIAQDIGVTRNAVIGRAHRKGVALREFVRTPRPPASRKRRDGKDDAFRIAVVCGTFTGESIAKAAKRLRISSGAIFAWRRNPEIVAQAQAMADRIKARWAEAEAGKARMAALFAADERERVDRHNAPIFARMSVRHADMMWRRVNGETLQAIASGFGLSKERIRQIEVRWRVEGLEVPNARDLNADAAARLLDRRQPANMGDMTINVGPLDDPLPPYWRAKVQKAMQDFPSPPSHP